MADTGARLPDDSSQRGADGMEDVAFWEDWRDAPWIALATTTTVLGALLVLVGVNNVDAAAAADAAIYERTLMLCVAYVGLLLWVISLMLTAMFTYDLARTQVRCSPDGITVNGVTVPWSAVRRLTVAHGETRPGPGSARSRLAARKPYRLDVVTDTDTYEVTSACLRSRAHELVAVAERFAPGLTVTWHGESGFRPKGPSRRRQPSRRRVRAEEAGLLALMAGLSVLACVAVTRLVPGWVTFY